MVAPTTKLTAPAGTVGNKITTENGTYTVASDLTVTVDSRDVESLVAVGYSVYDDDLAAGKALRAGTHVVSSGEDVAATVDIATGLASVVAINVMILRAGKVVTSLAAVSVAAGTITVADNSTDYVLTAADVIHWIAIGAL